MKLLVDKTQLPEAVLAILQSKTNAYAQAAALTAFVEQEAKPNVDTLVCLANLELACAASTEFEEDILDFGNTALHWLDKALELEPENAAIQQYIQRIRKNIRKAGKAANEILAYERENPEEMPGIDYVQELAFYYYARRRKSAAFAQKGYRLYKYVYEKTLSENPASPELLYYWHTLTCCQFAAEGFAGAETAIAQLISWELTPDNWSYRESITDGYWMKLLHYSEQNEITAFRALYDEWYQRMLPLEKDRQPYIGMPELLNPISAWLLQQEDADVYLAYLLENGYGFFRKKVLAPAHFEMMGRIKAYLKG